MQIIRKQATKCKFGVFEEEACKDQMVLVILDNALRKRYLQENDLTFEKALMLAIQFESM